MDWKILQDEVNGGWSKVWASCATTSTIAKSPNITGSKLLGQLNKSTKFLQVSPRKVDKRGDLLRAGGWENFLKNISGGRLLGT